MRSERVLHLINGLSIFGAERVAMELASQSIDFCHFVSIGLINGDGSMADDIRNQLINDDIEVICFSERGGARWLKLLLYCRAKKITHIHSHGYKSDIMALWIRLFLPRLILIATNHNYIVNSRKQRIYRWLDLYILKFYTVVIAVSSEVKDDMVLGGMCESKITIIDNGISALPVASHVRRKQIKQMMNLSESDFVLGIVASLSEEKAHKVLLTSFEKVVQQCSHCRLLIVGDGPLRSELETYCNTLGIADSVNFLGYRTDSRDVVNVFDIFVLPSYREGLPMALLEAMSAGIPVVASCVGAITEIVEDSINGLLVEPGSVDQLTGALVKLIQDKNFRLTIANAGQKKVVGHYSSRKMTLRYLELYSGENS